MKKMHVDASDAIIFLEDDSMIPVKVILLLFLMKKIVEKVPRLGLFG